MMKEEDSKEIPLLQPQEDMERGETHQRPLTEEETSIMLDALEKEAERRYHARMRAQGLPCAPAFRRSKALKEENDMPSEDSCFRVYITMCIGVCLLFTILWGSPAFDTTAKPPNPCSMDAFHEVFGDGNNKTIINFLDVQFMHTNDDIVHVSASVENYRQCQYIRKCLDIGNLNGGVSVSCWMQHPRPVLGMIDFPDTSMYEIYD